MGIIPFPYNLIAGAVASVALIGGTYGLWRHEVNKEVAVKIAAYVAKKTADDAALQAIEVKTNTKIQIQYVDRVKVIHDTGVSNVQVITKYVHDNEFLSNGWVSVHDAGSENGLADTTAAADGTSQRNIQQLSPRNSRHKLRHLQRMATRSNRLARLGASN